MLQFTYAHAQRTAPAVVLCVMALHVLAIGALLLPPAAPRLDSPNSVAIEMVLTPTSHTSPTAPAVMPTPKVTAKPESASTKAAATTTSAAAATHASPTPATAAPSTDGTQTPVASSAAASARPPSSHSGTPAFSLPSSEAQGLNNPQPVYPRLSRRLNEQGQVLIRVLVAADGSPQQGEIKTSSGFDRLDQEALRTVLRWRFVPGQRLGVPEAMWFNVPVNFVLE